MTRVVAVGLVLAGALAAAGGAQAAGRCGDRPWCNTRLSPDQRAGLLLAALTRDEKVSLLAGDDLFGVSGREGSHTGTSQGVPRVGLPTVYFTDGPVGVRQGQATGMPSSMTVAATFDRAAAGRHASVIGDEARRKGNDVIYAPAVNMMRTPLNGRTFEYFGEDPFLAGQMAASWTRGVQSEGVIANVKHYAVNNQEGQGEQPPISPIGVGAAGGRITVDARVDERSLREIYLAQFEAAVRAGAGSVMCSYNRINGQFGCENEHLLEDVLKEDWGFPGFVLTDYGAAKNTAPSLRNGLDLDIFPGFVYSPQAVNAALLAGQASTADVDEHVRRILRTLFAFGFFDRAAYVDDKSTIDQGGHDAAAAEIEGRGSVLLENDGGLLPLNAGSIGRLALIGPEADEIKDGGGSSNIDFFRTTTPKAGIEARLGAGKVVYDDGSDAGRAATLARSADVAVVVVGDRMTEGVDKRCLGLNCSQEDSIDRDGLIEAVAGAQPRTVVVMQTGGPVLTPWRDRVPALLEAWYPGQNGGSAIARVLFGDTEPAGRLPATFPLREEDEPVAGDPERYPGVAETVHYKEGVFMGYRWFDERGLGVAYPFGYGLGYTRFRVGALRVRRSRAGAVASVRVRNVGRRRGSAAPQLYVGLPDPGVGVLQPPKALKGFARLSLRPGQARRVSFQLDRRALSFYDVRTNRFRAAPGCYRLLAGASSRDISARSTLALGSAGVRSKVVRLGRGGATIQVTLRQGRRPAAGETVNVRGPGLSRSGATGRSGRVTLRVRASRSGRARVSTPGCASSLRAQVSQRRAPAFTGSAR